MAGFSRDRAGAASPLEPGPRSARFHIIDYDVSACCLNPPVDLATDRFANADDRTLVTNLRCHPYAGHLLPLPSPVLPLPSRAKLGGIAAAITIEVLQAAYGDALWIECVRDGRPWRMVVDGGPPEAYGALKARVDALAPGERVFDVVVVSHIDSDHIGGMLPLLAREDIDVGDVWFNALAQLPAPGQSWTRSVGQGEDLVELLTGVSRPRPLPWNRAFDGRAVMTSGDRTFRELNMPGGPRITLLSPTPKRLLALRRVWDQALSRLQRGESEELEPPAPPEPLVNLPALAATETMNDTSVPNGTSIAFLLEHQGASCLLGADAFPTVLGGALWALANARGHPVTVDAVKLPHHGSQKNLSAKLLTVMSSKQFLISTNGEHFGHPDDVALARAVTAGGPGTTLWFNYPATTKTRRWADRALTERYELTTRFADSGAGARLEFPERP